MRHHENQEPGDRGFLHDIRTVPTPEGWMAVIERVEEEDGDPGATTEIASADATTIPGFDEEDADAARHGFYFETDHGLPAWLATWAAPLIDASKDTDTYREHAAAWIGPDGDWS